jgi:ATP-dependent Clp endopeptidase proteolytic subunit ClpP
MLKDTSSSTKKKANPKHTDDSGDSDNDDDESKIVRENNHVYFYSEVSRESIFKLNILLREAEKFVHTMSFDLNVKNIPIYLHINSFGGSLYDAYAAVDTIKNLRVPVYSIIEGCAASAGTIIIVVCTKRFIGKNAHMLIHQLSSSMWGKMSEIEDEYKHLNELMKQIKRLYVEYTKISKKELTELLKHDIWLNPQTCIQYGLVDAIYDSSL